MSKSQPRRFLAAALLLGAATVHAAERSAHEPRDPLMLSQFGETLRNGSQNLTHSLTQVLTDTAGGTSSLAGSVAGIVAETVRRSATGSAEAAGRFGSAVAESVKATVSGTTYVAEAVGDAVVSTVQTTAFGTVRVAGQMTHFALDSAGGTVQGAVRLADAVGTIVAGTLGEAARSLIDVPRNMLDYATSLLGTPYKWGGTSVDKGMDCSGFVQDVVKQSSSRVLPRTAREMSREGDQVDKTELQPGDLVFFNTRRRPFSHVGIYLGDDRFVHAASGRKSGKQVRIDKLSSAYYTKRFNGARRLAEIPVD